MPLILVCLFDPSLMMRVKGMGHLVFDMIQSADIDTRAGTQAHPLSGGSSMPRLPSGLRGTSRSASPPLNGNENRPAFKLLIEDPRAQTFILGGSVP